MLGVVFYAVNVRVLKKNFLTKNLYSIEDIDSPNQSSGSLKIENLAMVWTILFAL